MPSLLLRFAMPFAVLALALPLGVSAQVHLDLGEAVEGVLTADDLPLGDGSYYDLYTFDAEAGQTYAVSLASGDFDAFLALFNDEAGMEEIDSNDDYGDTTNALVAFTADRDRRVYVRANSLYEEETGSYTLRVDLADPNDLHADDGYDPYDTDASLDLSEALMIDVGHPVTSELSESSLVYLDGTYYEPHVIALSEGETITITMRSGDFDSYLIVGALNSAYLFSALDGASDDDSGGDLDAQLTFTAPWTGMYGILANALTEDEAGTYTLSVTR